MWEYNHYDELYHYGVEGMKWGVIRANRINKKIDRISAKNEKLTNKRYALDKKAAKARYISVRKKGGVGLLPTRKSVKLEYKAAKLEKKANGLDNHGSRKYLKTKVKAAKLSLKSFKKMNASETTKKDYKLHVKAAKVKFKIEKNNTRVYNLDKKLVLLGESVVNDD